MTLFDVDEKMLFRMLAESRPSTDRGSQTILNSITMPMNDILTRWLVDDKFGFLANLPRKELMGFAAIGIGIGAEQNSFKSDVVAGFDEVQRISRGLHFESAIEALTNAFEFDQFNYVDPTQVSDIADQIGFEYDNNISLGWLSKYITVLKYGIGPRRSKKNTVHLMPVERAIDSVIDVENRRVTYKFKNRPDMVMEY